ncbi:DUF2345 domain-containing protein, partial [Burkholderia cepacia]|uniref:DUF2345 domain-containing protein n=1 Tax=Burkholderia cepacia TaxID=292 RepID=UPI000F5DC101
TSGGAYIRIKDGNVEIHAPGKIDIKGASHTFAGPASMGYPLPSPRPDQPGQLELLHRYADGQPVKGGTFSVFDASGGLLRNGALDNNGHMIVSGLPAGAAQVKFGHDPRDQGQDTSLFPVERWPAQPQQNSAADAAIAANQLGGLLPAAASAAGAGASTNAAGVANTAGTLAGFAGQVMQGAPTLASTIAGQASGIAQQAIGKQLPAAAQAALSQASQLTATARQLGNLAQTARNAAPALKRS